MMPVITTGLANGQLLLVSWVLQLPMYIMAQAGTNLLVIVFAGGALLSAIRQWDSHLNFCSEYATIVLEDSQVSTIRHFQH